MVKEKSSRKVPPATSREYLMARDYKEFYNESQSKIETHVKMGSLELISQNYRGRSKFHS